MVPNKRRYPETAGALAGLGVRHPLIVKVAAALPVKSAIIDGEVIVMNVPGVSATRFKATYTKLSVSQVEKGVHARLEFS